MKRKLKQWWSIILPISTKQRKLKEWWSIILPISTKQRKLKQWWSIILPISTKQRKLKQWWSIILPISTKQRKLKHIVIYCICRFCFFICWWTSLGTCLVSSSSVTERTVTVPSCVMSWQYGFFTPYWGGRGGSRTYSDMEYRKT
jgi:hypothetical protein